MNVLNILEQISAGSILSVIVIVLSLVEITPIKVSPLRWIGRRINKDLTERVDVIEQKQDEHNAESYRDNILDFQNMLLLNHNFTMEQWRKIIKSCSDYEKYVETNNLQNGYAVEAIEFIRREYQRALNTHNFIDLSERG